MTLSWVELWWIMVHLSTTLDTSPLLLEVINACIFLTVFIHCLEYRWRELTSSSQVILFHMFLEVDISGDIIIRFNLLWLLLQYLDVTYPAVSHCCKWEHKVLHSTKCFAHLFCSYRRDESRPIPRKVYLAMVSLGTLQSCLSLLESRSPRG